ncbi:Myxococcales GC_trans_RRR domain-containing protein/MYXO-CTERM domain-containing protein [Stigmatella aurantiaca]|uniref:Myxococcales GC_trans_RRR domain-containing protein/MYXO-CTERM domain-containing protein n=1 Tax=Stigmatella aurantiaca TaxID=41 RepID=A0A1H7L2Q5_STIAU|nr:Ig-like domain-containing protein [Stigmatella aurantiaca]SEK93114.1 Myxococcales GC_trans_RRR domain-containing protein/MYXO-CTERM domain-containing protein [Stigmatella aurantiaca]
MKSAFLKNSLRTALLALLACALPVLAAPDNVLLGTGRDGAFTATALNQVINRYAQVTVPRAPGDTTLTVGDATGFAADQLVMVIQMTGIVPEPPSGGTGPIDLSNNPVGRWEFARLASVSGTTLTLTAPLIHSYAANVTQVIWVPEYTTVSIPTGRSLTAAEWNGSTGGVLAFLATGAVTNLGGITVSGKGFRGGKPVVDISGTTGCTGLDEAPPAGAQKGEGIAFTRYGPLQTGRGQVANGGGGGVCLKSGGGGGGNAGAGGQGGNSYLDEFGTEDSGNRPVGGLGGLALTLSLADRLMMGGGGGAGHSVDGTSRPGGEGGGILFIRATQMTGPGTVTANGLAVAPSSEMDAAGGGGAGGSAYLRFTTTAATVPPCGGWQSTGGTGGTTGLAVGPGGGGGGGRIYYQRAGTSCLPSATAANGSNPGGQPNPDVPQAYGATAGTIGSTVRVTGSYPTALPPTPVVVTPANGSLTNNATPTYTGTLPTPFPAGTQVAVFVDSVQVALVTPTAAGAWTASPGTSLGQGPHTVYAVAFLPDQVVYGNSSNTNTFTVDSVPPAAPVVTTPANGSATNDSTPTYSGTAEPGSTVAIIVDGTSAGTAVADASGNWTFTPTTPLPDGPHTVRATASDAAGNVSPPSNTNNFTVDTAAPAAPVVTTPANNAVINDNTPTYSGTAEQGSTVNVIVDGVPVGTATANASGNWSFTPTVPLLDGPHTVSATATDAAGNTSPASNTNTFIVDTTEPVAPVVVTPANFSTTSDNTPTYSGTAEPGTTVNVIVNGTSVGTALTNGSGNWTLTPTTPLPDGQYSVSATATDNAGNTSPASNTNVFTVDTAAPAAPVVTTPANGSLINDTTPTYSGTAEPGSTVTVIVDGTSVGTATADASGNWSLTPTTPLAEGPHTVSATAVDAAGNTSPASNTNTFTVDATAPAAPVVVTPANGSTTSDNTPTFSGTAEPGSTVNVIVDGTSVGTTTADASGNWTFTPTAGLSSGPHTVSATAVDAAGNTSPASNTNTFTVDADPPGAPVVVTPANGSVTNDNTPTFSGTAEPGTTVTLSLDGTEFANSIPVDASGNWNYTPTAPLADGTYAVSAVSIDAVGNASPASNTNTFTVDATAPAAPVITSPADGSSTGDSTPTITGTAEPGTTVTVIIDGTPVGTAPVDASGNWTFTPPTPLPEGPHTVTATATDPAGNTGPASQPVDFIIDESLPGTPEVTSPTNGSATNDPTPVISGTAEPGTTVTVIIDGTPVGTAPVDAAGNWTFTPPAPLADGPHTVIVTATDTTGNVSAPSTPVSFTVDTAAPETEIVSGPEGSTPSTDATFTFSSNEEGVTYECSLDGGDFVPCTNPVTFPGLAEGGHVLEVRARDAAGNVDGSPATWTWTVTGSGEEPPQGDDLNFLGDGIGCASAGSSPASLAVMGLALLAALGFRRRRA